MRSCNITINTKALRHNICAIRTRLPKHTRLLAMVKANGYGHGMNTIAPFMADADAFGVASLSEALILRQVTDKPIVLIEGVFSKQEWQVAMAHNFSVLIHQERQLDWLLAEPPNSFDEVNGGADCPAPNRHTIWLKYNTGMNRLGFDKNSVILAAKQIWTHCPDCELILTSHFACADDCEHPLNAKQIALFDEVLTIIRKDYPNTKASICNSAGLINFPKCHYDWVRVGIALYGASPVSHLSAEELDLRPVMTLSARLMAIHDIESQETVGYGGQWSAQRTARIGVVSIGYGDGYPRIVSDARACIHTKLGVATVSIIGRVAMDMLVLDLTDLPSACLGDEVVLWGDAPHIDEVAMTAGTISYELMCRLTTRPERLIR